jgi:hypothetical protein
MYGRAGVELLRARLIPLPWSRLSSNEMKKSLEDASEPKRRRMLPVLTLSNGVALDPLVVLAS